jgi:hypothetical protein
MGRCRKWEKLDIPNKLEFIGKLCREGAIDKDIAKALGVGLTTFYKWQREHPEIKEVINLNKQSTNFEVEGLLLKRCRGYRYTETRIFKDAEGNVLREEIIEKEVPPDVTAHKFWLMNRMPKIYSDRHDVNLGGKMNITLEDIQELLPDD